MLTPVDKVPRTSASWSQDETSAISVKVQKVSESIPMVLLDQRIREGIIDYFEWVGNYQLQRKYQADVPHVNVPIEAINQWENWVRVEGFDTYLEPVFSRQEQIAIREFHRIWDAVADEMPEGYSRLEDLIGTALWERLRKAAEQAHDIFILRGHFDRNVIQFADQD
ncbi:hypothetical protein [Rhizobium sp. BT-226]|uniref:hypothetical protein n=1 Tax=Rhizobium sp. BT-226 TaxID=2986922 RepID=UPI0021F79290|nr:hypothetical protein [Rhizobium sp. BT-226]MCW0016098.1 hypothetical protein [Rhizobium sp. BT-226]